MPMKELKTFNLSYHFFINKLPHLDKLCPRKSKISKHMCFGSTIEAMKYISYNNR